MRSAPKTIIGVDEAGRGPLAGPVAVGAVMVPKGFRVAREFPGVADSKQLTALQREKIFEMLKARVLRGDVGFTVRYAAAATIDKKGIMRAVAAATARACRALAPEPQGVRIYLDGLLAAPLEYEQETIIGGDDSVPIISLASIAAKVLRDRRMQRLARMYPEYGFELHKGYGTAFHYKMLAKHGLSLVHRASYIHLA